MATIVQVNKRGSLTLPAEVRQFDEPAREGMRKVVSELAELYQRRQ